MYHYVKTSIFVPAFCLAFSCLSGQQANNWYFGSNAGISFNTNPPTILTNSSMYAFESCATISDSLGRLLFYTNGVTVWNSRHRPTPNGMGLKGGPSATAVLVVPKPGSNTIYYIFTADEVENDLIAGYNYSEVDMSLDGGLGDVTTNKNIPLYAPCTEKLAATHDANGIDIWVITKNWGDDEWRVYKIDCNGVHNNPVISHAGSPHQELPDGSKSGAIGYIKVSPDGAYVANARYAADQWDLLQFDNKTGILSNGISFNVPQSYGVEFAPTSRLVYVTGYNNFTSELDQYDFSVYDSAAIAASKWVFAYPEYVGALQRGPDNKIYDVPAYSHYLSIINAPDSPRAQCRFVPDQMNLSPQYNSFGLPVFLADQIADRRADFILSSGASQCNTIHFSANSSISVPFTCSWDFGDGATSTDPNPTHTYNRFDSVSVRLTITVANVCGGVISNVKRIAVPGPPPVTDFTVNADCTTRPAQFTDASTVAAGNINTWYWDFGDGSLSTSQHPDHRYSTAGNFTVKHMAGASNGCITDTLQKIVAIQSQPNVAFAYDSSCIHAPVNFINNTSNSVGPIVSWKWDFGNGDTDTAFAPVYTFQRYGTYPVSLQATTSAGCSSMKTKQLIIAPVNIFAGNDTTAALGLPLQMQATGGVSYMWSPSAWLDNPASANPVARADGDITYYVTGITASGCTGYDSLHIKVYKGPEIYVPNAFSPNGDGRNDVLRPILPGIRELDYFALYNRAGQLLFRTNTIGKGWDGSLGGIPQPSGVYAWVLRATDYQGKIWTRTGTTILLR